MREKIIQAVLEHKLIAIVRGVYGDDCLNLAKALYEGGIRLLEVTFDQAKPETWGTTSLTIRQLRDQLGDKMYFGAGTVTSEELVTLAKKSGAQFIVSPDCECDVIRATVKAGMVSMPGALTPTEVLQAHRAGADFVKLFPAGNLGAGYVKSVAAPINHVKLLAVGGVNEHNVADFLKAGAVGAGVGGNLVNKQLIAEGRFREITELAQTFVDAVK